MGRSCRTLPPYPGSAGSSHLEALLLPNPPPSEPGKTRGTRIERTHPSHKRPSPPEGPGRAVRLRVCPPWGENCWSHPPLLPAGVPIPQKAQAGPEGHG